MNIDNHSVSVLGKIPSLNAGSIVSLDQRVGLQGAGSNTDSALEFDRFYNVFLASLTELEEPRGRVLGYLKEYVNAIGERPYRTIKKQIDVLAQVMVRMKEQGNVESAAYKEIKVAFVAVSSANMLVQDFIQEVFKLSDDDDSRENSSW